jgi:hypothetical protein
LERAQGFVQQGNQIVLTAGVQSDTLVQASYPFATVTVFLTGSTTLAILFADNLSSPTPLANPFTADANGLWFFYAVNGRYDVMFSGGGLSAAWTMGDVLLYDPGL